MSFMTDAVLLQVACVAFKNDVILENVAYVWRTLPFVISIFLKKQENRISEKRNIEVSLHWFSKIPIREGVWVSFGHFCDRKSSVLIRDLDPFKYCRNQIVQTFKTLHFTSDLFKLYWNTEDSVFRFETGFGFIYEREGKLLLVDTQWLLPWKKKKKKS